MRKEKKKQGWNRVRTVTARIAAGIFLTFYWSMPACAAWETGDCVSRQIAGETYVFRCIDEDYIDMQETGTSLALFLCDRVIPANYGSYYIPGPGADGRYEYQFIPGPIVNFGSTNDYKYSAVRTWLLGEEAAFLDACLLNTGNSYAYTGSSEAGMYSQFSGGGFVPHYMGYQQIQDHLFLLSVDEALEYRDFLWKFDGSDVDNPESQTGQFCKGYWLRTPLGAAPGEDSGMVYIVDLVYGNIRPEVICPGEVSDDAELCVTGTTGVRPAFVMKQNF